MTSMVTTPVPTLLTCACICMCAHRSGPQALEHPIGGPHSSSSSRRQLYGRIWSLHTHHLCSNSCGGSVSSSSSSGRRKRQVQRADQCSCNSRRGSSCNSRRGSSCRSSNSEWWVQWGSCCSSQSCGNLCWQSHHVMGAFHIGCGPEPAGAMAPISATAAAATAAVAQPHQQHASGSSPSSSSGHSSGPVPRACLQSGELGGHV